MTVVVYLMQHGQAATEDEDPAHPLTGAGRREVERVAARAGAAGVRVEEVVHSGKLRAEQTARVLASALGAATVGVRDDLGPADPVAPVLGWLRSLGGGLVGGGPVAVVGHLPFLDKLASALVAGDEGAHVLSFRNGGLVELVPEPGGTGFAVAWALTPELA